MNYFESIKFVFEEVGRFSSMTFDEIRVQTPEDLLATLPSPDARGTRICGQKALNTLRSVSELAVQRSDYKGRIDVTQVKKYLADGIIDRFLVQKQDFTSRNVDRAVAAAVKQAANEIKPITHFIPCLIFEDKEPKEFAIGDVKFEQRPFASDICSRLLSAIRKPTPKSMEPPMKSSNRPWLISTDSTGSPR